MRKYLKWLGLFLLLGLCGLAASGLIWLRQYQALADEEPEVVLDPDISGLTYCTMDGLALEMDLYFPEGERPFPTPLLVYVHGGSFTSGDKASGSGIVDIPAMTARGFVVAAVNYRLMPEHPFPAEVQDVKCAIRFLRAHAQEYAMDVEHIGIWGGSAGGHLAAMMGLTNGDPGFEVGEWLEQSSRVDAVVEMFGPSDLARPMGAMQRLLLRRAFGTDDPSAEQLVRASPVNYVTAGAPPFLILHGAQDSAVPVEQAQILEKALSEAGVPVTLVVVKNANHNFKPTGGAIEPGRAEISDMMGEFFERVLGK